MEHNIEDLVEFFSSRKSDLKEFLIKHFKEDIDYKLVKDLTCANKRGGRPKEMVLLTKETCEIIKNTYKSRQNRDIIIVKDNVNIKYINKVMNLEQSTIGFIYDCFSSTTHLKLQYKVKTYKIDCYFIDYRLAIECDEFNHKDRDIEYEIKREYEIIKILNCKFIRFNPNDKNFKLQQIISQILEIIL